jgi:hypothetical protein
MKKVQRMRIDSAGRVILGEASLDAFALTDCHVVASILNQKEISRTIADWALCRVLRQNRK